MAKVSNVIGDFFSSLLLIILCMVSISPFVAFSFISIKFLLGLLISNTLAVNFISILLTLVIFMYIPECIFITLWPIIERYAETSLYYPKGYKEGSLTITLFVLFKVARPRIRLCIYAISFILIFINNIYDCGLRIPNQYFNDIRVVINGAVLTFIVFDRVVNEYYKLQEKVEEKNP